MMPTRRKWETLKISVKTKIDSQMKRTNPNENTLVTSLRKKLLSNKFPAWQLDEIKLLAALSVYPQLLSEYRTKLNGELFYDPTIKAYYKAVRQQKGTHQSRISLDMSDRDLAVGISLENLTSALNTLSKGLTFEAADRLAQDFVEKRTFCSMLSTCDKLAISKEPHDILNDLAAALDIPGLEWSNTATSLISGLLASRGSLTPSEAAALRGIFKIAEADTIALLAFIEAYLRSIKSGAVAVLVRRAAGMAQAEGWVNHIPQLELSGAVKTLALHSKSGAEEWIMVRPSKRLLEFWLGAPQVSGKGGTALS